MATDQSSEFGRVSRLRGNVFEAISLGSSLLGIVTLGTLLAVVTIDAFGLAAAAESWVLAAVAAVVVPSLAICTHGLGDASVRRRAAGALLLGIPAAFAGDLAASAIGLEMPLFDWHLLYLFAVVLPVTGATLSAGTNSPTGSAAMGFLGRIVGGLVLGGAILILFVVVEPQLWFLLYTLGVLPFVLVTLYARQRPGSVAGVLRYPFAVLGLGAAFGIHQLLVFYTPYWLFHVWSVAIPVAAGVAVLYGRRRSADRAQRAGIVTLGVLVLGSLGIGLLGVPPSYALFGLLGLIPAGLFAERVCRDRPGLIGLSLPVVLLAGIAVLVLGTDVTGIAAPEPWLDWSFLTSVKGLPAADAGFYPAIVGSVVVIALVAILSFAFGVGTAILLEEYTSDQGLVGSITRLIQINIANLAAVPSVVYGLLGLAVFANLVGFGFGTIITASLTLSLLILPITIISAQEAIRSVPDDLRRGSDAMGATRWQTTKNVVIPEALPGIFTGTILALGRAIGETAPLLLIGAAQTKTAAPSAFFEKVIVMPLQLYAWYNSPNDFQTGVVPAGVVALLVILLVMNGTAIVLRNKYERSSS